MIELHLIGYTADLEHLVLDLDAGDGSGRYRLVVEPDLFATLDTVRRERRDAGLPVGDVTEYVDELGLDVEGLLAAARAAEEPGATAAGPAPAPDAPAPDPDPELAPEPADEPVPSWVIDLARAPAPPPTTEPEPVADDPEPLIEEPAPEPLIAEPGPLISEPEQSVPEPDWSLIEPGPGDVEPDPAVSASPDDAAGSEWAASEPAPADDPEATPAEDEPVAETPWDDPTEGRLFPRERRPRRQPKPDDDDGEGTIRVLDSQTAATLRQEAREEDEPVDPFAPAKERPRGTASTPPVPPPPPPPPPAPAPASPTSSEQPPVPDGGEAAAPEVAAAPGAGDEGEDEEPAEADEAAAERVQSELSPAEIQYRLRRGRTPEEVAEEADTEVDWIRRWLPPIEAERARILEDAQASRLERPRLGPSRDPLAEAVRHNLVAKGVDEDDIRWTVARRRNGSWKVNIRYRQRGRRRSATWTYRPEEDELSAASDKAREVGFTRHSE